MSQVHHTKAQAFKFTVSLLFWVFLMVAKQILNVSHSKCSNLHRYSDSSSTSFSSFEATYLIPNLAQNCCMPNTFKKFCTQKAYLDSITYPIDKTNYENDLLYVFMYGSITICLGDLLVKKLENVLLRFFTKCK